MFFIFYPEFQIMLDDVFCEVKAQNVINISQKAKKIPQVDQNVHLQTYNVLHVACM